MAFTHLHVHTCYSLLDGSGKIPEMIGRAKELGMDSMAITDHGVMYGVIDFYKEAKAQGIRPILGCEIYLTPGSRFDREPAKGEDRYYHLVLLAENDRGYANLMKIVSRGFLDGFYYKPRVDFDTLREFHEGLIALSACLAGELSRNLVRGMYEEAKKAALRYQEIFGEGNFFLELQDHGYPDQARANQGIVRLHNETGIPLVATNDIHYTMPEDARAHDILLCLQTGKKVHDEDRMRYPGGQFYIKSEEEMRALFPYAEEAIDNTARIAERCNVNIEFGHYHLPKYEPPGGLTPGEYLEKLCLDGLRARYGQDAEKHRARLDYELRTIASMGFVEYFLIVWDYIHFAKTNDISVGPGRGSAAGSLVAYCIGITDVDPIRYNLIFERFLNPERVTMPDIDVDFEYERRQEVIDYVTRKYGLSQVAQIVTFGTLAARGVVRDVGRVLDISYAKCDMLAKMIPTDLGMTLDKALEVSPELVRMYGEDEETKTIIDMARRLEGLPRHTSTHAAGVVISGVPVEELVPLCRGVDNAVTTQFTMTTLEELGLLKMDFLGLRTLTVIKDAVRAAARDFGGDPGEGLLSYDDPAVYEMISDGDCAGVFQLESDGMTSFMKRLKPGGLEDIIAGVALYRPGPMDFIPKYIEGKRNSAGISYDCPEMEPILAPTYGCIVYQEQVMQIVQELAGYSMGRSDIVRRAMSKKKASVMEEERRNFVYGNPEKGIPGCVSRGISEETANHIYDEMIDFAKYAFNKSHAACYAVVAYQTAFLKKHYPLEFFAALMTSFMENSGKVASYIEDVREMGVEILPPDVNRADVGFAASPREGAHGSIRYGISAVKGIGRAAASEIVRERRENGEYRDLEDFAVRVSARGINRKAIECLIQSGGLDCFPGNRREKFAILPTILEDRGRGKKDQVQGQMTLMDLLGEDSEAVEEFRISMPRLSEYPQNEILQYEKDAMGIYLSGHPLDQDRELLRNIVTAGTDRFRLDPDSGTCGVQESEKVTVGGMITEVRTKTTKKNEQMAFVQLEDMTGSIELTVFPRIFQEYRQALENDRKIIVSGRVQLADGADAKLIVEKVTEFSAVRQELWIRFGDYKAYKESEKGLENELAAYACSGTGRKSLGRVFVFLEKERVAKHLPGELELPFPEALLSGLREKLGGENIRIRYKY